MAEKRDIDIDITGQAFKDLDRLFRQMQSLEKQQKLLKEGTEDYIKVSKKLEGVTSEYEDLSEEVGLSALNTNKLRKEATKLNRELQKIPRGTKAFQEKARQLGKVKDELTRANREVKNFQKEQGKASKGTGKFTKFLKGAAVAAAAAFGIQQIGAFISKINVATKEFNKLRNEVQQLTGATGNELNALSNRVKGLAKTYDEDYNEVLRASNALAKQYKISQTEALNLVEKGFIKGGNVAGDFLDRISEYPVQLKEFGLTAEEAIKVIAQSPKSGIFSDKFEDSIKEATLSINEFTKTQVDALAPLGDDFVNKLFEDIATDSVKPIDALRRIKEQGEQVGLTTQQIQTITADVFKGAGEDAGGYAVVLENLDKALATNLSSVSAYEKQQQELLQINQETARSQQILADAYGKGAFEAEKAQSNFQRLGNLLSARLAPVISGVTKGFNVLLDSIIGYVDIPISEEIQSEQVELNALVEALQDSIEAEEDNAEQKEVTSDLIGQLNDKYPTFLENLSEEELTNEELAKRLKEVNKQYNERIVLAQKEEIIAKFQKKSQDALALTTDLTIRAKKETGLFSSAVDVLAKKISDSGKLQTAFSEQSKELQEQQNIELEALRENAKLLGVDLEEAEKKQAEQAKKKEEEDKKEEERVKKEKERLKNLGEARRQLAQANEEALKAELEAQKRIQDLKITLIDDEFEQRKAKINLNFERELEDLKVKGEQRIELEKLLRQQRDAELDEVDKKRKEKEKAEREAEKKEFEEQFDQGVEDELDRIEDKFERQALLEREKFLENEEVKKALLEGSFEELLLAEEERDKAILELRKKSLEAQLQLAIDAFGPESKEAQRLRNALNEIRNEGYKKDVENAKNAADAKDTIAQESFQVAKQIAGLGIELLGADEEARKKNAGFLKVFSVAQIAVDLEREIAGYFANIASTQTFGVAGAIKAGIAIVRATSAISKIKSTQFSKGGFFNINGSSHRQGGIQLFDMGRQEFLPYNIEGNETIISEDTTARFPQLIKGLVENGSPPTYYQDGGTIGQAPSTVSNTPSTVQDSDPAIESGSEKINVLIVKIDELIEVINDKSDTFKKSYVSIFELEDRIGEVQAAKQDNTSQG